MQKDDYTLLVVDKNILLYLDKIKKLDFLTLAKTKVNIIDLVYYRLLFSSDKAERDLALKLSYYALIHICPTYEGTRIATELIIKEPKFHTEEEIEEIIERTSRFHREHYGFEVNMDNSVLYREKRIAHTVDEIDKTHILPDIYAVRNLLDKEIYIKTDLSKFLLFSENIKDISLFSSLYEDYITPKFIRIKEFIIALEKSKLIVSSKEIFRKLKEEGIAISEEKESFLFKNFIFDMAGKENMYHTKEAAAKLYIDGKITERTAIYYGDFKGYHDLGEVIKQIKKN